VVWLVIIVFSSECLWYCFQQCVSVCGCVALFPVVSVCFWVCGMFFSSVWVCGIVFSSVCLFVCGSYGSVVLFLQLYLTRIT